MKSRSVSDIFKKTKKLYKRGLKKSMKTVKDLTRDEINELKMNYFYSDYYDQKIVGENGLPILFAEDIPDKIIFDVYSGIDFVEDDFFCNIK